MRQLRTVDDGDGDGRIEIARSSRRSSQGPVVGPDCAVAARGVQTSWTIWTKMRRETKWRTKRHR